MAEQLPRAMKKASKTHELKKMSSSSKDQHPQSKKQQRKGENPVRIPPGQEPCVDLKCSNSWICKNSACRATLSADDTFCKRCSCCICHLFDDNKDPSLWLECTSESGLGDACGLSCHIECALQRGKVGVVDLGLLMQLDGSYCCASCGKVSGILGCKYNHCMTAVKIPNLLIDPSFRECRCWKKQLIIAKDARRVDVLCYRIFLSYRLLDGTSRFNELHEFVRDAKAKLETEVGPVDGVSAKMARGIVSRLSVAEGSLPAACKFLFEEVTSSSFVVLLIDLSTSFNDDIKGYKLWYCKSKEENYSNEPACVFPRDQRRIWISNLQPCTEYSIRIISYTDTGDFGHSEVKCFTKSVEIIRKNYNSISENPENNISLNGGSSNSGKCFAVHESAKLETREKRPPSVSRQLDLNVASVPDLNEEFTPPIESSRDEVNGCTFGQAVEADDDAFSHEKKRKHSINGEMQDSDSTLTNDSGCLDENFEYCVKIIRWMECEGYIKKDFRLKLLTWFSLRSTEQERRVALFRKSLEAFVNRQTLKSSGSDEDSS
ncbi:hypothetical protein DH2020_045691 [Rehmannia glutinosa]|uniref:Fibronectin type-III domain-containing protein n=1 Tax=Rehmannia glutinosa TaxID=99300 RepID=A0ABR0UDG5_REHGL